WCSGSTLPPCPSFFFSSRRRHTSFSRDWSSDVCSYDLVRITGSRAIERFTGPQIRKFWKTEPALYEKTRQIHLVSSFVASVLARSEERRVGKERRCRRRRVRHSATGLVRRWRRCRMVLG